MPYAMIHRKEVPELNILRAFAFLAVVLQSALSISNNLAHAQVADTIIIGMLYDSAKFSAPVFIFLTGYGIITNGTRLHEYAHYLTHKGKEILIPYLFWSLIYFILLGAGVREFGWKLIAGEAAPHMWYVVMVFQFHLLAPLFLFLFRLSEQYVTTRMRLAGVMAFVAGLYSWLLWMSSTYIYDGRPLTSIENALYIDRTFFAYAFYFVLGGVLAKSMRSFRTFAMRMIPLNSFLFFCMYFYVNYQLFNANDINELNLKVSTYLKPSMFLYVVSLLLLLYTLSMLIANTRTWFGVVLYWISEYTYTAYLSHFAVVLLAHKTFVAFAIVLNPVVYAICLFFIGTIGSVGISWFLSESKKSFTSISM
ncbi:MAG: acyltransferase family protein [Bacilli bacterium]